MALEITGKVSHIGEIEAVGANNSPKRLFCIEVESGKYQNMIAFDLWKDKTALADEFMVGDIVDVKFDIKSREYSGKWYTNATAWSVKRRNGGNSEPASVDDAPPADDSSLPF